MKIQSATPVPESGTDYPTPQKLFTIEEIAAHIKNTPCPTSGSAPYFTEAQWKYAQNRFLNTLTES